MEVYSNFRAHTQAEESDSPGVESGRPKMHKR
jgi:hypothetical protein